MSDVLIRDIPDDVLAAIDAHAVQLGISRSEYIRRLAQEAAGLVEVTAGDLRIFAETFADLNNDAVMAEAWE